MQLRTRSRVSALWGLLAALLTSSAAAQSTLYQSGRAHWQAQRYPQAKSDLSLFRATPFGRTADVDYMLGTSACRLHTAEDHAWGGNVLAFVLKRYQLTAEAIQTVQRELDHCRRPATVPLVAAAALSMIAAPVTAGATMRGKMFTGNASRPLQAYTARALRPLDLEKVRARITPLQAPEEMAEKLKQTAGGALPHTRIFIHGRFAFAIAAGQSEPQVAAMAGELEAFLDFLERAYAIHRPPHFLTIYLVPRVDDLRTIASVVHALDVSPATIGYTFQDDCSAVAVVRGTKLGTLKHELFHMMARSSFGDIPQWLDEGSAALYEESALADGSWVGRENWRGPILAARWPERPSIAALIGMPWDVSDQPGRSFDSHGDRPSSDLPLHFAAARYVALWLQDLGKLQSVYASVRAIPPGRDVDPSAAERAALEAALGPLDAAQAAFDAWFSARHAVRAAPRSQVAAAPDPGRRSQKPK